MASLLEAAGCAVLAAFFCGEVLASRDVDPVPPGEYMVVKAIADSIVLAAVSEVPEKANEKSKRCLEQDMVVAKKTGLWISPAESSA